MIEFLVFYNKRSPAYVDDVHYLSDLLDVIGRSSPENATALRKVQPQALQVSPSPSSPDSDMDDSVARTMRKYVWEKSLYRVVSRVVKPTPK